MRTDAKRSIWAVTVLLFMGSLRGSELLSYDKIKFDPVKTLLGGDISLIKAIGPDGKEIELLSIRLKQPKTARSNPHQVVELAETRGASLPNKGLEIMEGGKEVPTTWWEAGFHLERWEVDNNGGNQHTISCTSPKLTHKNHHESFQACSTHSTSQGGGDRAGPAGTWSLD